jgi:hypothetical protein
VKVLADGRTAQCATCGALAVPVGAPTGLRGPTTTLPPPGFSADEPLVSRLIESPGFLLRPSLLAVLAGLAILTYLVDFSTVFTLGRTLFVRLFVYGLEAAIYFNIVRQVAWGNDRLELPEPGDLWDGAFGPAVRYLFSFLPFVGGVIWAGQEILTVVQNPRATLNLGPPAALILAWVLVWPLMTAIAALGRSTLAMYDPSHWVETVRTLGKDYVVGTVAFLGVLAIEVLVVTPVAAIIAARADVPVLSGYVAAFLVLVPKALRAKVLGEMLRPYA